MKNKLKKFLIFGAIAVCLAVGLTLVLVFGLKDKKDFTVKLDTLATAFDSDGNAKATLNDTDKTLTLENMDYGDSLSFYIRMSNTTENNYNYRIRVTTETGEGETANSQFASNVVFEMFEEDINPITIYGNTEKVILQRSIKAETTSSIIRVKVSFPEIEGFDIDSFEDRTCTFKINVDSALEDDGVDYDKDYSEVTDATSLGLALAKDEAVILLNSTEDAYTLPETIEVNKSLKIYGEHGATNTIQGSFLVGPNGSLEIENTVINGHIQTVAEFPEEETQTQALKATALDSEQAAISQSVITLNNVEIYGGEERINSTGVLDMDETRNDTLPAILIETNTLLNTFGNVKVVGNWDATAIGVAADAKIEITGDSLTAIGNGGYEVLTTDKEYYTDAESAQKLSADPEFSAHLANEFSDTSTFITYNVRTGSGTSEVTASKYVIGGGSGIGAIYQNNATGEIYIHDMKSLTAEGYGQLAFGVGGGVSKDIKIENTRIEKARGGLAVTEITAADSYYWATGINEGGSAIGTYDITQYNGGIDEDGKPSFPGVILNQVVVKAAYGGHKAAGIGSTYWTPAKVIITNSQIENVWGGSYGAGIGGSRIDEGTDQPTYVEIQDSTISVTGGAYAAGIGSASCDGCRRADDSIHSDGYTQLPLTTINIKGGSKIAAIGGMGGAGIGTGVNGGRLEGTIESTVDTTGTKSGGFGEIVSIRNKQTGGNYVYSYKFCEFVWNGNYYGYYAPVAESERATITQEELESKLQGYLVLTKPQDIGLGTLGGQWVASSAHLVALGLADIDETTGELKNTETVEKAIEIYNLSFDYYIFKQWDNDKKIDETEAETITTMQDFVDYVYNTPKGYEPGDANYHVWNASNTYYVTSGLVDNSFKA